MGKVKSSTRREQDNLLNAKEL
jgi:hypothetical protein